MQSKFVMNETMTMTMVVVTRCLELMYARAQPKDNERKQNKIIVN